ncbi:DUF402 domain-containing protein [Pilimelia columellifera]|uniref:DUF402 domain-containing protein n=1 Tax=Pilimelia columellifera subsp. columellifera TaxID=706583 RepID=A0ABP6AQD5_9ACTN
MGGDLVRVIYTKFDGSAHRDYPAWRLAENEHGVWLGVRAGTDSIYHGRALRQQHPYVVLVPRHAWWTAMFSPEPRTAEVYCDVTTPARWPDPGAVELVDLDLDVVRRRGSGLVQLLDQEEFAMRQEDWSYPPEVVRRARQAAGWLYGTVGAGVEPFHSAYRPLLDQMV